MWCDSLPQRCLCFLQNVVRWTYQLKSHRTGWKCGPFQDQKEYTTEKINVGILRANGERLFKI